MTLFPYLQRNQLGTLSWRGLKMTQEFINDMTMPDYPHVKPQIPNFSGKQSACNWARCHGLLHRDTKDSEINVIEKVTK